MGDHLLSLLHIQKLGHPIEEIRLRALASVISKHNLNLVDECNLKNTKLLLEKLLDWFDFEKYTEEKKVLNLILKIFKYQNADLILREIDQKSFLKRIREVEKKADCECQSLIQDIIKCISHIEETEDCFRLHVFPHTDRSELVNGSSSTDIYELQKDFYTESSRESKGTEGTDVEAVKIQKSVFKIEYFPWQYLTPGDKQVLSVVYDGLRYINNKNLILQSCQFFKEVLLRDFPTEVFIQRPLIIRTFLQLIECTEQDVRIPVVRCLIKMVQCLKESMQAALNASLFHLKKEFYTTSVFANMEEYENFSLNMASFDEDLQFDDNDYIVPNLKKYQLSVPQFCFEILLQILPHLNKKCSQEEANLFLNLSYESLTCLVFNLNSGIWAQKELKNKFYKIFGKLYEILKVQKGKNQIVFVILLYFIIKLLKCLKPPSGIELCEILVGGLQSELGYCLSDFVLVSLFPQLHSEVLYYVEQLPGQKEKEAVQNYKDVLIILESMKSCIKVLNSPEKLKTRMEKLECLHAALPSLDFHQNINLIQFFVNCCLLKWRKSQLKESELNLREKILIKLLAHCNDVVKICIYKEVFDQAMKLLGIEEAKTPRFEFPGDRMDFLFRTNILTEIICHGLSSPLTEVRKYSCDIIHNLLKSKFIMSEICWSDFMSALIPCLSLLQCFADKSTILGRCIVKMFDPDVAKSTGLSPLETLKGNMRFLFSKNNLTRDEAITRLFWLLSKEDLENKKLPRMSVLTGLNLSGICSCVKPQEFTKIRHSFYSPGRLTNVLEMLSADNVEPNLRRSALSQISVMMDDTHLHSTFLEQKGLEKIIDILDNCLIEKEYRNHPDSVKPIIDILKALAFQNVCVRQELSCQIDVMYNILRGLFLFSSDSTLRQNAVELICLLLYSDCILRVPSDLSIKCTISFPELVVNRMCLPFLTHIHWRNSRHLEPSIKKSLMSKENCLKLISVSWAAQWAGGLPEVLSIQPSELPKKVFSPGIPDDMKISFEDVDCLRGCSFSLSVKQTLYNIQNATTHEAVFSSLHKLHCYFLLCNIDKAINGRKSSDIGSDTTLSHMLWESTLERFMTSHPSCNQDEALLLQVIQFVQLLLRSFKSERLIDWVGKLLIDEHQPLTKLLKKIGNENFGLVIPFGAVTKKVAADFFQLELLINKRLFHLNELFELIYLENVTFIYTHNKTLKEPITEQQKISFCDSPVRGKELRLTIIELTQQVVTMKTLLDRNKWFFYLELISNHLKLDKKSEFYNVAYVDWFLSLLVDLTGSWSWNFDGRTKYLETLIIRIMEIIIAFHCTKDSAISFMGINIVRSSLLILNHIMASAQGSIKGWEKLWFEALCKVIGHERDANYCWMLSLWFTRDSITRAAAYSLFVSFSASSLSCDLLIDNLNIRFDHVWTETFRVLFDENECSFVREKAAFLLSNLTNQGTKSSCGNFLQHLQKINFYQEAFKIISNYDCEPKLSEVRLHGTVNRFSGHVVTTPSFVTSLCILIMSVMTLNPTEVSEQLLEHDVIGCLVMVLGEIPESTYTCGKHHYCLDVIQMYVTVCKLFIRSVKSNCSVHSFMLQSQQYIISFFSMMNFNLYCKESNTITTYKMELWTEILDLFSALLADTSQCNKELHNQSTCFILINKCMTDNGIDNFISSLYIAMSSDDLNLRSAVFKFFINLFRQELNTPKHISVSDIFERKISSDALKSAKTHGWKALNISESLTLSFGIRAADILTQIFLLSNNCAIQACETTIADCLGSLLAVCKSAQNFCVEKGLADSLILILKQISVKLNLESVENLRKSSTKKKIDPYILELETLFKLICNLVFGNEKAKSAVADCALSTVLHKLWPWCMAKRSLLIIALKMLCTFTHFCDQACRTLVLSGNLNMLGLKKSPGSLTLINAITNQVILEMDLFSNSHDSQVLRLCLQLLTNCCRVSECRSVISKGNFLQCFTKLHPNRKKLPYCEVVIESWLKFLLGFSSHQDGQLILTKNQDLLDLLILKSNSTKASHRIIALNILRNICFHQLNRVRMLGSCSFLSLMFEILDSKIGEEVQAVAVMIWALTCNSQKAKLIIRSSGFDTKLMATKRKFIINEDMETAGLIEVVLGILKNK